MVREIFELAVKVTGAAESAKVLQHLLAILQQTTAGPLGRMREPIKGFEGLTQALSVESLTKPFNTLYEYLDKTGLLATETGQKLIQGIAQGGFKATKGIQQATPALQKYLTALDALQGYLQETELSSKKTYQKLAEGLQKVPIERLKELAGLSPAEMFKEFQKLGLIGRGMQRSFIKGFAEGLQPFLIEAKEASEPAAEAVLKIGKHLSEVQTLGAQATTQIARLSQVRPVTAEAVKSLRKQLSGTVQDTETLIGKLKETGLPRHKEMAKELDIFKSKLEAQIKALSSYQKALQISPKSLELWKQFPVLQMKTFNLLERGSRIAQVASSSLEATQVLRFISAFREAANAFGSFGAQLARSAFRSMAFMWAVGLEIAILQTLRRGLEEAAWFHFNMQLAAVALGVSIERLTQPMSKLSTIAALTGRDISTAARLFYEASQVFKITAKSTEGLSISLEIVKNAYMAALTAGVSFQDAERNFLPLLKLLVKSSEDVGKVFSYLTYVQDQTGVNADVLASRISYLGGGFTRLDYLMSSSSKSSKVIQEDFKLIAAAMALMLREMDMPDISERISRFLTTLQDPKAAAQLQLMGLRTESLADFLRSLAEVDLSKADLQTLASSIATAAGISRREGIFIYRLLQIMKEVPALVQEGTKNATYLTEKFRAALQELPVQMRILNSTVLSLITNLGRMGVVAGITGLLTTLNSILIVLKRITDVFAEFAERSKAVAFSFRLLGTAVATALSIRVIGGALATTLGAISTFVAHLKAPPAPPKLPAEAIGTPAAILAAQSFQARQMIYNLANSIITVFKTSPALASIYTGAAVFASGIAYSIATGIQEGFVTGKFDWKKLGRDFATSVVAGFAIGFGQLLVTGLVAKLPAIFGILKTALPALLHSSTAIVLAVATTILGVIFDISGIFELAKATIERRVAKVAFPRTVERVFTQIGDFIWGILLQFGEFINFLSLGLVKIFRPTVTPEKYTRGILKLWEKYTKVPVLGPLIELGLMPIIEALPTIEPFKPVKKISPEKLIQPISKSLEILRQQYEAGLVPIEQYIAALSSLTPVQQKLIENLKAAKSEEEKSAILQTLLNSVIKERQEALNAYVKAVEKELLALQFKPMAKLLLPPIKIPGGLPPAEVQSATQEVVSQYYSFAQTIVNNIVQSIETLGYANREQVSIASQAIAIIIAHIYRSGLQKTLYGRKLLIEVYALLKTLAAAGINISQEVIASLNALLALRRIPAFVQGVISGIRELQAEKIMRQQKIEAPDLEAITRDIEKATQIGLKSFKTKALKARGGAGAKRELWEILKSQWEFYKAVADWSITALRFFQPVPRRFISNYLRVLRSSRKAAIRKKDWEKATSIERAIEEVTQARGEFARRLIERAFIVPLAAATSEVAEARLEMLKAQRVYQRIKGLYQRGSEEERRAYADFLKARKAYYEAVEKAAEEAIERKYRLMLLGFLSETSKAALELSKATEIYNTAVKYLGASSQKAKEAYTALQEAQWEFFTTTLRERERILEMQVEMGLLSHSVLESFYNQQIALHQQDLATQLEYRRKLQELREKVTTSFKEAIGLPEIRVPTPQEVQRALINQLVQNVQFTVNVSRNVDMSQLLAKISEQLFGSQALGGAISTYV